MSSYLAPVEKPKGIFIRLGYWYSRKEFGKVFSPLSVFCARMPTAFTRFYTTIGKLDKKVAISPDLTTLIRERVASVNACAYCMDANRFAAIKAAPENAKRFDALDAYDTSDLFSAAERAAIAYVTELTRDHAVDADTFAELVRHYDEEEICGIVYVTASEHVFNLTNIGLNIGSDSLCEVG